MPSLIFNCYVWKIVVAVFIDGEVLEFVRYASLFNQLTNKFFSCFKLVNFADKQIKFAIFTRDIKGVRTRLKIILKIWLLREKNITLMFKLFTWSMVNDLLKPMLFTRIVMSSISVSSREASIFDNSIKASFVSSFLSKPTVSSKMKKN